MREILGLDHDIAANDILRLGVWTVVDHLLCALDHLAGALQRMAGVLDMAVRAEFLKPRDPFLHGLLHVLGRRGCLSAAKQIGKFTHDASSLVWSVCPARMRRALPASHPSTCERNGSGHFFS